MPRSFLLGAMLCASLGTRVWWKRCAFSMLYQPALLNNEGTGITPTRQRIVVGPNFNLDNN